MLRAEWRNKISWIKIGGAIELSRQRKTYHSWCKEWKLKIEIDDGIFRQRTWNLCEQKWKIWIKIQSSLRHSSNSRKAKTRRIRIKKLSLWRDGNSLMRKNRSGIQTFSIDQANRSTDPANRRTW